MKLRLEIIRKWFFVGLALLLMGIFFEVSDEVFDDDGEWSEIDHSILVAVSSFRAPEVNNAAIELTSLGSYPVMTVVFLLVMFVMIFTKNRIGIIHATFAFIGTGILQGLAKAFFDRPRPNIVPHLVHVSSSSFPSGHSFAAAAIYLSLALLGAEVFKRRSQRTVLFSFAAFIIFIVGFTRIFLGVHYPSDVLSGICIGSAWALLLAAAVNWYNDRFKSTTEGHKKR